MFDLIGCKEFVCFDLFECIDEVWYGYLLNVYLGIVYGFCVDGLY